MSILGVDYFAAKRLVELYESLTDCAARAIEQRRSKLANGLNARRSASSRNTTARRRSASPAGCRATRRRS
jgi:hypothetical protein